MLLQQKNAIIYGAGGSVGSAMARAFASVGANVFLAGRNLESVREVAAGIVSLGGKANAASVDAMDEIAVKQHLNSVVEQAGSVDISFNLVDLQVVQNMPLVDMTVADFVRPSSIAMQSHFITATLAGKQMIKQGSGVILSLTATPGALRRLVPPCKVFIATSLVSWVFMAYARPIYVRAVRRIPRFLWTLLQHSLM
jgi:3-oxoacyl-[acyl-carrier protein] reductase